MTSTRTVETVTRSILVLGRAWRRPGRRCRQRCGRGRGGSRPGTLRMCVLRGVGKVAPRSELLAKRGPGGGVIGEVLGVRYGEALVVVHHPKARMRACPGEQSVDEAGVVTAIYRPFGE